MSSSENARTTTTIFWLGSDTDHHPAERRVRSRVAADAAFAARAGMTGEDVMAVLLTSFGLATLASAAILDTITRLI